MSQIVERKKKGRPSKADLALRAAAAKENDIRRTLRHRNVRYNVDFGDEDDKDELRREKKLKLLLKKLQSTEGGGGESSTTRTRHVAHAPFASASSSSDGDRPSKKRKIDGDDDGDGEIDGDDEYEEVRRRKEEPKVADSVPGTPSDPPAGLPLPEKKSLELILDKLQKKDTYGVYAEPVDAEELPDYHDVIEHPMDFATVRKKLENGSYSALEQFESDVYLICTNAMQYNAPDTIYYKQAHSIQELAKKKFQGLRFDDEHYEKEKELKSEQKPTSNSSAKKQIKKPMSQTTQEPVGSDFFSGATLATAAGDFNATHDCGLETLTYVDGPVVGNTSLFENNLDKAEDLQGRVPLSRFGRKAFMHDGNRRATYIISRQPMVRSKSIFTTFDSEIKQLVAVGSHEDHSYARSLARFAATLGPVAWKVASTRIEDVLPTGFKFGRGWVGYYEPLPTPILMLENCSLKEPVFLTKSYGNSDARKDDKTTKSSLPVQDHPISFLNLEGKPSLFGAAVTKATVSPTESAMVSAREQSVRGANLEGKQPFLCSGESISTTSASANYQQQSPRSRRNDQGKKFVKQVELNSPILANQNTSSFVAETQISNGLDVPASLAMENVSRNRNLLQSVAFKQPENHGFVAGGLTNGKLSGNSLDRSGTVASSSDSFPKQIVRSGTYFPHGPEQGLSDPVQLRRMLAENADKQQKSLNHSPVSNPSVMPQVPSSRMDDSNNASAAAARTWMSIGEGVSKTAAGRTSTNKNQISADSLNNPSRDLQRQVPQFRGDFPVSGMHFHPAKNSLPLQAFVTPPVQMGKEAQIQNRPMNLPPSMADLPRFQMQSPWQGVNPQRQSRQKQESLPPDLNIGVQSPGSPVRQSGVLVDSQHPDLALQL